MCLKLCGVFFMTSETDNSIIKRESQQPELFNSAEMESEMFKADEDRGEFTGERLYKNHPEKYRALVALLVEGLSVRRVCDVLKVSHHTVLAVRQREGSTIATLKERLAVLAADGAKLCVEAIVDRLFNPEDLKKISARDLSIIAGVLVDKGQLLSGGVTARVEITGKEPGPDDFNRQLAEALASKSDNTGYHGETDKTKEVKPIDADFTMVDDQDTPADPGADQDQDQDQASNPVSGAEDDKS